MLTGFTVLGGVMFSGCNNETVTANRETTVDLPVFTRAVPDDAIEIPDTTTVIAIETGGTYVINGSITAQPPRSVPASTTIYIAGTWTVPTGGATFIPKNLTLIITDGGTFDLQASQLPFTSGTAFYVQEGGTFRARNSVGRITLGESAGSATVFATNYGVIDVNTLTINRGLLINLESGVIQLCSYFVSGTEGEFFNYGTFLEDVCQ